MTLEVLREGEAILHLFPPILGHLFMQREPLLTDCPCVGTRQRALHQDVT